MVGIMGIRSKFADAKGSHAREVATRRSTSGLRMNAIKKNPKRRRKKREKKSRSLHFRKSGLVASTCRQSLPWVSIPMSVREPSAAATVVTQLFFTSVSYDRDPGQVNGQTETMISIP